MKKIMNTAESFVYDMCHGMAKAHPELEFVEKYKVVKKKVIDRDKVTLISGGGSGHEPAHAGLSAQVCWTPPFAATYSLRRRRSRFITR